MNCHEARKWFSPYLDSELGHTKTFEVSEHLRRCDECRQRFEAERRTERLMTRKLDDGAMPAALWERIKRDVNTAPWRRMLRANTGLALAASLAFVVILGALVWPTAEGDPSPAILQRFVAERPAEKSFTRHTAPALTFQSQRDTGDG